MIIGNAAREMFENAKKQIVDVIVSLYGEDEREIIEKRVDNTYLDFTSTPDEEYKLANNYKENVREDSYKVIERSYMEYKAFLEQKENGEKEKSAYEAYLGQEIKNFYGMELSDDRVEMIANTECGCSFFFEDDEDERKNMYILKYPIATYVNKGHKGLTLVFIHELIHRIESGACCVGIKDPGEEKNQIANEIRTQKKAIAVVEKLRERGLVLFDVFGFYPLKGECVYDWLFPFVGDFFEKNQKVVDEIAIKNEWEKLNKIFGPSWDLLSSFLNLLYEVIKGKVDDELGYDGNIIKAEKLIEDMYEHSQKKIKLKS